MILFCLINNYAFITGNKGVHALDIQDTSNISYVSTAFSNLNTYAIALDESQSYAFVSRGPGDLQIFDISDRTQMSFIHQYPITPSVLYEVFTSHHYTFVCTNEGVTIIDNTNASSVDSIPVQYNL